MAVCREIVLLNETKSNLTPKDVDDFVNGLPSAREFFPEYATYHFIGALASLYVDPSVVRYGERQGILMLGMGRDLMDIWIC